MRTMILLASACLAGGTVEAQATAQGRAKVAEREVRKVETEAGARDRVLRRVMVEDTARLNRATLGVTLGGSANRRDTLGVFVQSVVEDGPAERAGIFEGHRIAFINNVDVRASAADAGDPYLSTVGAHRLVRAMRDVTPGSTVTLRVWTGSGYRDVQLTASRFGDVYRNQRFGVHFEHMGPPGAMGFAEAMAHTAEGPHIIRHREVETYEPARARTATPRAPRRLAPGASPLITPLPHMAPGAMRMRWFTI